MPYSHPQPIDRKLAHVQIGHLVPGAMVLAASAGFINSVVLGFFRTPVSHMTGAVSYLGVNLAEGHAADAMASLSIVVGFFLGAMLSGLLVGALKLVPGRRYGGAMIFEGMLLAVGGGLLMARHKMGLPAIAMACGLQNAMTSSYCGLMIRTTHVTGMVTDIGVMIGHWLRHRRIEGWKLKFLAFVFGSFAFGGWMGAMADLHFGPSCLRIMGGGYIIAGSIFWYLAHRRLLLPPENHAKDLPSVRALERVE